MSATVDPRSSTRLDRFLGTSPEDDYDRRYVVYLIVIAIAGWALASYDFNLLVVALPTISKDLHMSETQVGLLGFLVYGAMLLFGVIPLGMVIVGRRWVRRGERYEQLREIKQAKKEGDEERVKELLEKHDVDVDEVEEVTIKQLFTEPGWVRSQLARTTLVWLLYSSAFVATNTYIVQWLTSYRGFSNDQAEAPLLVAAGVGFFFYVLGGALGAGKIIIEELHVPDELAGRRCFLTAFPVLLKGCGGAWTRAVAWELEE